MKIYLYVFVYLYAITLKLIIEKALKSKKIKNIEKLIVNIFPAATPFFSSYPFFRNKRGDWYPFQRG